MGSTSVASLRRCCPCRSPGTTRWSACSTSRPSAHGISPNADVAQLSAVADLLAGIVEKGRLQRDADEQVATLLAVERARTDLIALVTHELRTPLAVVRAYLDLLADAVPADAPGRAGAAQWHEAATDQVMRLDRLVDSILASVRPDAESPVERVPVDVDAAVDETLRLLGPLVRRHEIECEGECRARVQADASRFRQILEHLVENAVKYTPPGSRICIGVETDGSHVLVSVSDQGPGIPEEWRERIFEPYARRDTHTARGSGIGLYAARRLAEAMGARLWCEAGAPGGGARFVLSMPAAPGPAEDRPAEDLSA